MAAATKDPDLISIPEIARTFGISEAHIRKVTHELMRAGFLTAERGRMGGYRLGRDPGKITVASVIRFTEPNLDVVECFDPSNNQCRLAPGCVLKSALRQALHAFVRVLDGYTIADLVKNRRRVAELLGI